MIFNRITQRANEPKGAPDEEELHIRAVERQFRVQAVLELFGLLLEGILTVATCRAEVVEISVGEGDEVVGVLVILFDVLELVAEKLGQLEELGLDVLVLLPGERGWRRENHVDVTVHCDTLCVAEERRTSSLVVDGDGCGKS